MLPTYVLMDVVAVVVVMSTRARENGHGRLCGRQKTDGIESEDDLTKVESFR